MRYSYLTRIWGYWSLLAGHPFEFGSKNFHSSIPQKRKVQAKFLPRKETTTLIVLFFLY